MKNRIFLKMLKFGCFLFILPLVILPSCDGSKEDDLVDKQIDKMIDSNNIALGVSGKVFLIPSPIQTAMLIQKSGAQFNKAMLNPTSKVSSYSTSFQKCLNLGIYGADLGYITLYDQNQDAISYFKATNNLATELGLGNAFDKNLIDRFQTNLGNKDSIISLVSMAYRSSNDFLKNNDRSKEAALVVAGGWVETLQFALSVMAVKPNEDIKRRIAEQKSTLSNLISLLAINEGNEEYSELLQKLNDLKTEYEQVTCKYLYQPPVLDQANKTTSIVSKSEINISSEAILNIGKKVASIRALIVA